jgi:hypothetical protein
VTSTVCAGAAGADDVAGADVDAGADPAPVAVPPLAGAALAFSPKIAPMIFPKILIVSSPPSEPEDDVRGLRRFCVAGSARAGPPEVRLPYLRNLTGTKRRGHDKGAGCIATTQIFTEA